MRKRGSQHHIDGLLALLLFGVFAVCVLAVLLTGADAYRRLTQRDQAAYDRRTCEQYLTTRVRPADRTGSVAIENRGGTDVLVLGADEEYITYIYHYEGWLMELYIWSGEPLRRAGSCWRPRAWRCPWRAACLPLKFPPPRA